MDTNCFDALTRALATLPSRRTALRALAGATVAVLLTLLGSEPATAKCARPGRRCRKRNGRKRRCCGDAICHRQRCRCPRGTKACGRRCIQRTACCRGCAGTETCRSGQCVETRCAEVLERRNCSFIGGRWICSLNEDLRGVNLSGCDLAGAKLERADMEGADLADADLRGAELFRATLGNVNATNADLRGADLRDTGMGFTTLVDADLRAAALTGSEMAFADLNGALVAEADLSEVSWSGDTTCPDGTSSGAHTPSTCCCNLNGAVPAACTPDTCV